MAIWGLCFKDGLTRIFLPQISLWYMPSVPRTWSRPWGNLLVAGTRAERARRLPRPPALRMVVPPILSLPSCWGAKSLKWWCWKWCFMLFHDVKWVNMKIRRLEDEEDSLFFFNPSRNPFYIRQESEAEKTEWWWVLPFPPKPGCNVWGMVRCRNWLYWSKILLRPTWVSKGWRP